jgi:dolichol-phosphate mannosyltransferase
MDLQRKQSWSVFVAAYNEESTVRAVIEQTIGVLQDIAADFSVLVIDDGSTDGTAAAIQQAVDQYPRLVRALKHPVNLGIGATLADGYRQSDRDKEVVCGIPADGEFDVECLRAGARALEAGDVVVFYREGEGRPWFRRFFTMAHRLMNRWLLGLAIRDVNWVKIYKRSVLEAIPMRSKSPLIETEILAMAKREGARILELPSPTRVRVRHGGAGLGGTLKNGVYMTVELLRFYIQFRFGRRFRRVN